MRRWRIALLALAGLRRAPLRVLLTALGVAIASSVLVTMVAFALGLQRQIEVPVKMLSLLSDIEVSLAEGDRRTPPLDDAALARLAEIPGVAAAMPNVRTRGIKVRRGRRSQTTVAIAAPREMALLGLDDELLAAGRFFDGGLDAEAILGEGLLKPLGFDSADAALGASLSIEAAGLATDDAEAFSFRRRTVDVTVVGVYRLPPIVPGPSQNNILLPLDLMKELPGTRADALLAELKAGRAAAGGYDRVTVRVREPRQLAAVEARIKALGYKTKTTLSRFDELESFFVVLQVLLAAIGSVALVVAALGIVNTLLMAVLERYQEIGICKAIGASVGDLALMFLAEAAMIGLLGGLGGVALGRGVSFGLGLAVEAYARWQGATGPVELFAFPAWLLLGTVGFAILISVLAGVYPAVRAARIDPIAALRRH